MIKLEHIPLFVMILSSFGCGTQMNNNNTQPLPSPTASPTPIPSATPSPGINYPIVKASPQEVCYGDQVTLNVQWDKDAAVAVYLERNVASPDKLPPLYQEHVLVKRLELASNAVVDVTFSVTETLTDLEKTDKVMNMTPGKYWTVLVGPSETVGGGGITVKNCP